MGPGLGPARSGLKVVCSPGARCHTFWMCPFTLHTPRHFPRVKARAPSVEPRFIPALREPEALSGVQEGSGGAAKLHRAARVDRVE